MSAHINSAFDPHCTRCPRLAQFIAAGKLEYPDYHCGPVAPFGDAQARLIIVGLAPGFHGANATGRPFTGDYAGILLYDTLYRYGFASAATSVSAQDGLQLINARISNAVKCVPPENKPTPAEIRQCNGFLKTELLALAQPSVLLALGTIAHGAVLKAFDLRLADCKFAHGAEHGLPNHHVLLNSYHCSRYNTNTRRLTESMFHQVFARAKEMIEMLYLGRERPFPRSTGEGQDGGKVRSAPSLTLPRGTGEGISDE
jgi:uracil-DNA glycosylase family 4